jgi:hypothetical protein
VRLGVEVCRVACQVGREHIDRSVQGLAEAVRKLHADGKGPTAIAKELGISRMHAHRIVKGFSGSAAGI